MEEVKNVARRANPWVDHVKSVALEKGISYGDALKIAKDSYSKSSSSIPDRSKLGKITVSERGVVVGGGFASDLVAAVPGAFSAQVAEAKKSQARKAKFAEANPGKKNFNKRFEYSLKEGLAQPVVASKASAEALSKPVSKLVKGSVLKGGAADSINQVTADETWMIGQPPAPKVIKM